MDNVLNNTLKTKIEKKLQKIFDKMACENPEDAIHGTALTAAGVVALLPIGIDAWALRACEIYMLMSIYSHYGVKLTKSTAESLMTAAFAQAVGEAAAYIALESANAAAYATGGLGAPAAYAIKVGIATTLIEAIGWTTVKHIEGNKLASAAIHIADGIGVASDVSRVVGAIAGTSTTTTSSASSPSNPISFTGAIKEGTHLGHVESYWKLQYEIALKNGNTASAEHYWNWWQKAIANRPAAK